MNINEYNKEVKKICNDMEKNAKKHYQIKFNAFKKEEKALIKEIKLYPYPTEDKDLLSYIDEYEPKNNKVIEELEQLLKEELKEEEF